MRLRLLVALLCVIGYWIASTTHARDTLREWAGR